MTAHIAPEHDERTATLAAEAYRTTVLEPDGQGEFLDGTLHVGGSGIGVWAAADVVLPVEPALPEGPYRVAIRTRAQPPVEPRWAELEGGAGPLVAVDHVIVAAEGAAPVRWEPARLGGDSTAPVWKQFALLDPEKVAMGQERRAEQWLEVMRSATPDGEDHLFLPDAGGRPGAFRVMPGAQEGEMVPRLRVSEFRGPTAVPGDVITGADLLAWVGLDVSGRPVALALDVGTGMRLRATRFVDVSDAWAEPVGAPVGRPRVGSRLTWRFPYSEHFVRPNDGGRASGMLSTPVRIGTLRFPSGRIALTAPSLSEEVHVLDLKVPQDRELPCFVSGELHREPAVLIRVADGRPVAWHLALGRDGRSGTGSNGAGLVITDADVAGQAVHGRRRPDRNARIRIRLHTPQVHAVARPEGDSLAIDLVVPTILPIVGLDAEGRLVAVSFLAAQSPDMISGPREAIDILDLNVMAREHAVCVFVSDEGYTASMAFAVPLHRHNDEHPHAEPEGQQGDGDEKPPGFDQERLEIVELQREALQIVGIARVVQMASEAGTAIRIDRSVDGWRWSFVSRGGVDGLQRAVAEFTGVRGGRLESDAFSYEQLDDGWWSLTIDNEVGDEPPVLDRTIVETDRAIDVEAAALLIRQAFTG